MWLIWLVAYCYQAANHSSTYIEQNNWTFWDSKRILELIQTWEALLKLVGFYIQWAPHIGIMDNGSYNKKTKWLAVTLFEGFFVDNSLYSND